MYIKLIKFTSGGTPADLFTASMALKPFSSIYLYAYVQTFMGLKPGIECAVQ